MARPDVTDFTDRLYGRLPDLYRAADEDQADGADGWPFLRYLSLLGDLAGEVETLFDRVDHVGPADGGTPGDTSDLADPATADAGWLEWLAQAAGVDLGDVVDVPGRRALIANANDNRADGSVRAIRAQVAAVLGEPAGSVVPNYGSPWTVAVVVPEHPDPDALLAAAMRDKPAGVVFVLVFGLAWRELESGYPTWADIEAAGSWSGLV